MRRSVLAGAAAAVLAATGTVAAVGLAGGQDHTSAGSAPVRADGGALAVRATRGTNSDRPVFTHLITSNPIDAANEQSTYVGLKCPRRAGSPISGSVTTNGAANMGQSLASIFDPIDGSTEKRTMFVGTRNDSGTTQSFRGNVVCVKKAKVK